MERTLETAFDAHLIGSLSVVEGTIVLVRNGNPFTNSIKSSRQWMLLLTDVRVGGCWVSHIWISGCRNIHHFRAATRGTRVYFTAHVRTYDDQGLIKWTAKPPFRNCRITYIPHTSESKN